MRKHLNLFVMSGEVGVICSMLMHIYCKGRYDSITVTYVPSHQWTYNINTFVKLLRSARSQGKDPAGKKRHVMLIHHGAQRVQWNLDALDALRREVGFKVTTITTNYIFSYDILPAEKLKRWMRLRFCFPNRCASGMADAMFNDRDRAELRNVVKIVGEQEVEIALSAYVHDHPNEIFNSSKFLDFLWNEMYERKQIDGKEES